MIGYAGQCSFGQQDFIVWTAAGHDMQTVHGTVAECEATCCLETSCVGFGRNKAVAANLASDCWLKGAAPVADQIVGDTDYEMFMKGALQLSSHLIATH